MENTVTVEDVAVTLDRMGLQYLATIGLDGRPKVRPVQYMVLQGGKLWFCTNSEKAMYAELQSCPFVDLCASRLEKDEISTSWIRFSAEVVFEENRDVKQAIMEKSAIVHELYGNNPDHPLFKVFYLKDIRGSVNNLGHVKGLDEKEEFDKPVFFDL
ncbi:MAG TPA: hypothetical protein DDW78_01755 [Treponema sp.]|nr:hypothetical protein [Treponema sp.]